MSRVLVFLALLLCAAFGLAWLADRPGEITLVWQGYQIETSLMVGIGVLVAILIAVAIVWKFLRFVLDIPSLLSKGATSRRMRKGRLALTRGMIAAGAGDARNAARASAEALRRLGEEPLTLLLKAEAAQLAGDRATAEATFARMAEAPETRVLGLRGLYVEARRRGDVEAAYAYAREAHRVAPLAWAGTAVLDHHAIHEDWSGALLTVGENHAHKLIDDATADRQRAVLLTALARAESGRDPEEALRRAREAAKLAPDLAPAVVLTGRLYARKGDIRRAARTLEAGWRRSPHPDIARAYLDVRPGDSAADRLARARVLERIASEHPEARMAVAGAAIDAREFTQARRAMAPLVGSEGTTPPTVRMCLLMADLEETEHGVTGAVREWLARASRARRDPAWIADGIVYDSWFPASPVTGKLDAFVWRAPEERLSAPVESPPVAAPPPPAELPGPLPAPSPMEPQIEVHAVPAETAESTASPSAAEAASRTGFNAAKPAATSARPAIAPLALAPDDPGPRSEVRETDSFA
ncbi:MAG TPA: heme biosynthesis HemY N-terminal domain-containing protein [Stellaceae bacterium]|jgi:HemY protein|nr:heme biosynthesis HemY N-terminal domain-containing protein [Stellaceae bacterium]